MASPSQPPRSDVPRHKEADLWDDLLDNRMLREDRLGWDRRSAYKEWLRFD
jgi:hypothetical protein